MTEDPSSAPTRLGVVFLAVFIEGGLVVLALLLGWTFDQPALRSFHWIWLDALDGLLAALPMVLVFLGMHRWPVGPVHGLQSFTDRIIRPMLAPCTLVDLLGISVLAGLGEELFFRAVLQEYLAHALPTWAALLLASTLFGVMHAVTRFYAFLAVLAGLYLGSLLLLTDNVLVPALCHTLYDFVVLVYLLRGPGSEAAPREEPEE